jgi:hypothetical protein
MESMTADELYAIHNNKKADIQRQEFKKIKGDSNLVVRDPYTGDPWEYNDEITKLFDDMIVNKTTN